MKLKCDIIIQNLNQNDHREKTYKESTLSIYRAEESNQSTSELILIVKPKVSAIELKYRINKIETYTKFIAEGKATINLVDKNILLLISNTPSQNLINFISFLKIKFNKNKNIKIDEKNNKDKENENETGKASKKENNTYVNKLLNNVECSYAKNNLKVISPLTDVEIHNLVKGAAKNKSFTPVRATSSSGVANKSSDTTLRSSSSSNALKELSNTSGKSTTPGKTSSTGAGLVKLTPEQVQILQAIKDGKNIFFTGGGGTGKSFLLKVIPKCFQADRCFITASTGIAACLIGGTTLHTFAGVSANDLELPTDVVVEKIKNSKAKLDNWKKCKHLIIDEISMIDGDFFDKLDEIGRAIRNNDRPFGGIQLIISGDFLQLPPVAKRNEVKKYCFQANCWNEAIDLTMQLTEVQRQTDKEFIELLEELRFGRCSKAAADLLMNSKYHKIENGGILPTKLCTHKDDVDFINRVELDNLKTESVVHKCIDSDSGHRGILNMLCPAKDTITLKIGAQVMLVKNLAMSNGLVNGSRGIVVGFTETQNYPIVRFYNGKELPIKLDIWMFRINSSVTITRKQLPLQLAWALSIHKSQGMTLDCVEISLSRVFECGQAYVALSRARSLKNLRIIDFDPKAIKTNETVIKYYQSLNSTTTSNNKHLKQTRLSFD